MAVAKLVQRAGEPVHLQHKITGMEAITKMDSIDAYNKMRGVATQHPLVSVVDLAEARLMPPQTFHFGLYVIYLKMFHCGELRYGRSHYDFQEGTLVFVAPGQVLGAGQAPASYVPSGWSLAFHPDLIKGTALGRHIQDYTFFSYDVHEALHLSEKEQQLVLDCFAKIRYEMEQPIDKHSKTLIVSNIELFLNYCVRFYDRQFITRDNAHKGILQKFEALIGSYFASEKPYSLGLPTVAYCAGELNLSANYFGDLVKKETGISAQEYIQAKVIDLAKERIFDIDKSISQIAYELGFKYPQHFTRLFKQKTGMSPVAYRSMN